MFVDEAALEERLATPSPALVADLARLDGDLLVLGAGGKMGPSLCRLARRALDAAGRTDVTVHAVSRWSDRAAAQALEADGVRTVAFDLMDPEADLGTLPDAGNIVFMVGAKFGSAGAPSHAWAVNAALPDRVVRRWPRARIAAFSTGNVYPLVPVGSGGCTEEDPVGPVGEYAMSCLGRERIFGHAALTRGTPVALIRLNYAVDLRYGVLADIAARVLAGEPVDVTTGHANVVWQGYANEVALRSLLHAGDGDGFTVNLTGPETASVRRLAHWFGTEFGKEPSFEGEEAATALLSDASRCHALFGYPDVPLRTLVAWQADWLRRGLPLSGRPTKFQVRDGRF
ncbi:NAD(P)-dependent oxidoreductase [Streptomyces sp. VRA16 Mangrove soil]|uniref:NAD-dependent epimerase/dehydratase family protein n=1 Tax=Streptomyces sp. VRA16 Mangrove soil TaxID=2817434 RepID=UPI001A9F3663|nr:epimerase [Streptomyces sp. VRA16 Mangrove soil]MBO1330062.1 epimerase [Streptomyces sp. VRA16 Mangrove soil]